MSLTGVADEHHLPVICHWSEYPAEIIYLSYVTYRSIRWKSSTCRNTLIRSTQCGADHLPVTCHWPECQVYIIYLSHVSDRGTRCCAYIIPITCYWPVELPDEQHLPIDRDHVPVACHWPEYPVETIYLVHISDRPSNRHMSVNIFIIFLLYWVHRVVGMMTSNLSGNSLLTAWIGVNITTCTMR